MTHIAEKPFERYAADVIYGSSVSHPSGWERRLGYSLQEGLRRALNQIEPNAVKVEQVINAIDRHVDYIAITNDLFIGGKDGYAAAISFQKKSNPGNGGETRLAVRTPENNVVFVAFSGQQSKKFQGFDNPERGFNYWWWRKESKHWVSRLSATTEESQTSHDRQFYNDNPKIVLPPQFFGHLAKTPEIIIELLASAAARVYSPKRNAKARKRKEHKKKIYDALIQTLWPDLNQALEKELPQWLYGAQLNSPVARLQMQLRPKSYGIIRFFSECSAEICERRARFAETFPFMVPILARPGYFVHLVEKKHPHIKTLFTDYTANWLAVVDNNEKFLAKASEDLSAISKTEISPALVKRIAKIPAADATDANIVLILSNLKLIAPVPPHLLPTEPAQFIDFVRGVEKCRPLLIELGQDMGVVIKNSGKNFTEDMAKIGESAEAHGHIKDYINAVFGKIVLAWGARQATEQGKELDESLAKSCSELYQGSILQNVVQSRSVLRLIEASQRWHKGGHQNNFVNQYQSLSHLADGVSEWPAITQPVVAPNGYKLVPLTCQLDLQEEGKLLSHCVGGYSWSCIGDRSHIISVQDEHGGHISTLQIKDNFSAHGELKLKKGALSTVQHRAYHNGVPPAKCLDAVRWYIEEICDGKLPVNIEGIREARKNIEREKARNLVSQKIGYHPDQTDMSADVYNLCRNYLPPGWPKPNIDSMVKALGVDEIIENRLKDIPVTIAAPNTPLSSDNDHYPFQGIQHG